MNPYRQRILRLLEEQLALINASKCRNVLDFGAGDGWFSAQISKFLPDGVVHAVDIQKRTKNYFNVNIIDTNAISVMEQRSFDLVYAIDVLHHCNNPMQTLADLANVSRGYLLIKDHIAFSRADHFVLGVLDEIGNRRFGIPSNYHYQHQWKWEEILTRAGWETVSKVWPASCHTGILGALTNRLQYIALYRSPSFSEH